MAANHSGIRLKKVRKYLNLTQVELSEALGTAQNTISNYESGRRSVSHEIACSIRDLYHVSYEWLMTGHGHIMEDGSDPFDGSKYSDAGSSAEDDVNSIPFMRDQDVLLGSVSDSKMRVIQQIAAMSDEEWKPLYRALNALFGLPDK